MVMILFLCILTFFVIGMPIAFAMGVGSFIYVLFDPSIPLVVCAQRVFSALDSWPLMAIPLFMLAGSLMDTGGMSKRIVAFASSCLGFIKGSLAMVCVMASMVFAGITGSSTADTAAIGSILLPAMREKKYDMGFATALQAAAGSIGPIIPPSIMMIFIGYVTETSISKLFLAGVLPGLLIGGGLMIVAYIHACRGGEAYLEVSKFQWSEVIRTGKSALPGLGLPFIIIFGIIGGVFTATEAAVVAVVYGLLVGLFVYKEIKFKDLPKILLKSAEIACVIMFVVTTAFLFAWLITVKQVPQNLGLLLQEYINNKILFLIILNIALLVVGMFMESFSAIIVFLPIFFPISQVYGIDPVHFGAIVCVNLAIGYVTPPYGATLFVACGLSGKSIREVTPHVMPILLVMVIVLLLITYVPSTFMWIPNMLN